jgi:hypothetical protein
MVPLAAVATVVQALPAQPAAAAPRREVPAGSIAIALVVMAGALVVNSPLMDLAHVEHRWAWGFLGFWAELGGLAVVLGMLFRQPVLAWVGAALFFFVALALSGPVWIGHPFALALVGAVAAWQMRRQRARDQALRAAGRAWLQA